MSGMEMARTVAGWSLACALAGHAAAEPPLPAADAARHARILSIAESTQLTREQALLQLDAERAGLPGDASWPLQRELLRAMRAMQIDAGRFDDADRSNEQLRTLGQAAGDAHALADAGVHDLTVMVRQTRIDEARGALAALERQVDAAAPLWLRLRLHVGAGRLFHHTSEFEKSVHHFLEAERLARQLPRRAEQETQAAMSYLVHLYTSMEDPERAVATARRALAMPVATPEPRLQARLYFAKALALITLKREHEAWPDFERALAISRKAGLAVMEAFILGNMADAELRAQRWVQAEKTARQAYAVSTRIGDAAAAAIARANIGFALGGQGKLAEALPWVDGEIEHYRRTGGKNGLYAMLDEKSRMLERNGRVAEALAVSREQQQVQSDLFSSERARAIAGLTEKFEADSRRREIELLRRDNQLKDADIANRKLRQLATTLVAALTVALGGVVLVLYRRAGKSNAALRMLNARLEFTSTHDPLTGLYNRRSFVERMHARTQAPAERRLAPLEPGDAIILLDIDHFKAINDSWGHAAGDAVLVALAERLGGVVREGDMVLRWGGEEFLVYSPGATREQARALAGRILAAIGQAPVQWGPHSIAVTASAGFIALPFAGLPEHVFGWEQAVGLADAALYLAKQGGRNRACGPGGRVSAHAALEALEHGLGALVDAGVIELDSVAGPARAMPAAAPVEGGPAGPHIPTHEVPQAT